MKLLLLQLSVSELLRAQTGTNREEQLDLNPDEIDDIGLVTGSATVTLAKIPGGIYADIRGEGRLVLTCDRCLATFESAQAIRTREEFREEVGEEEWPIDPSGRIDLREPIRQALILAIPIHPLCREDCPGLPNPYAGRLSRKIDTSQLTRERP